MERSTTFLDFDCQYTYKPGTDPADELLHQVVIAISDDKQSEQGNSTLWPDQSSDESLYEATMQFSDEK